MVPGRCNTLQWIVSHPKVGGKQTLNLTGSLKMIKIKKFLKEDMKFKGRNLGGYWEQGRDDYDQIQCVKFSKDEIILKKITKPKSKIYNKITHA